MLVKSLIFSFPAADAYIEPGKLRATYIGGNYAICRHPGFWWPLFFMGGLTLAAGLPVRSLILFTVCNFALILFEDILIFPAVLSGYVEYKAQVPMLIPDISTLLNLILPFFHNCRCK